MNPTRIPEFKDWIIKEDRESVKNTLEYFKESLTHITEDMDVMRQAQEEIVDNLSKLTRKIALIGRKIESFE